MVAIMWGEEGRKKMVRKPSVREVVYDGIKKKQEQLKSFFEAIREVESGGDLYAVGDDGKSHGPYQISKAYFADAVRQLRREGWLAPQKPWPVAVYNVNTSEELMLAYWRRYANDDLRSLNYERLYRIHNGGPRGHLKQSSLPAWRRVQAALRARGVDDAGLSGGL